MSQSKFKFFHLVLALGAVLAINSSLAFADDSQDNELYIRKGSIPVKILEKEAKYSNKKISYSFDHRDQYPTDFGQITLDCVLQSFSEFSAQEQSSIFSQIDQIRVVEYKPSWARRAFSWIKTPKADAEYDDTNKTDKTLDIEFVPNYAAYKKGDVCKVGAVPAAIKLLRDLKGTEKKEVKEVDEGEKSVPSASDAAKTKADRDAEARARAEQEKAAEAQLKKTLQEVTAPLPANTTPCDGK